MITAQQNRIDTLYHYQIFNINYLDQTINNKTIYMPNPSGFNDPWDCRPYFNSNVEDPTFRRANIDWYIEKYRQHLPTGRVDIEGAIAELSNNPEKLKAFIEKTNSGLIKDIDKSYRMYCLTPVATSPLMWAHYTDKHKGVCLEYRARNTIFGTAIQMNYVDEYPDLSLTDDSTEANVGILTTKSGEWSYENEYRLIAIENGSPQQNDMIPTTNDNVLIIPNETLLSIIVGCMMPDSDVQEIRDLIRSSGSNIRLRRAVRSNSHYSLNIIDI